MNQIEGMEGAFKKAKIVFMTTYSTSGEEHFRPMTNFNENPYETA